MSLIIWWIFTLLSQRLVTGCGARLNPFTFGLILGCRSHHCCAAMLHTQCSKNGKKCNDNYNNVFLIISNRASRRDLLRLEAKSAMSLKIALFLRILENIYKFQIFGDGRHGPLVVVRVWAVLQVPTCSRPIRSVEFKVWFLTTSD